MRLWLVLVCACALLWSSDASRAQEALTMTTPPGKPLVWDPEIIIPEHDPGYEVVVFRLMPLMAETADLPFFVDLVGIVVPRVREEEAVALLTEEGRLVLLVCSFTSHGSFDLVQPEVRSRYCVVRHAERQP